MWSQFKLLRFAILPAILSGISYYIGPHHSESIKSLIGVVIGCAIQHRFMAPAIKSYIKSNYELFKRNFDDED